MLWLLAIFVAVIAAATMTLVLLGFDDGESGVDPYSHVVWDVLTSALDPVPRPEPEGDNPPSAWPFRLAMLGVTFTLFSVELNINRGRVLHYCSYRDCKTIPDVSGSHGKGRQIDKFSRNIRLVPNISQ